MKPSHHQVTLIAQAALNLIAATPPAHVYAGIRGRVMAAEVDRHNAQGQRVAFRRVDGVVRMELWPQTTSPSSCNVELVPIPEDLQQRAAQLLDSLP